MKTGIGVINFLKKLGVDPSQVEPISSDASTRRYYRLTKDKETLIFLDSSSSRETIPSFLEVREYLAQAGYSVPEVRKYYPQEGYLILEDLGRKTLEQYLPKSSQELKEIYLTALDLVFSFQKLVNPPLPAFDKGFFLQELAYFTKWYIAYLGKNLSEAEIRCFKNCWDVPLEYLARIDKKTVFVHKDLHCGNLFWIPSRNKVQKLGLIDFQAAKNGSGIYDITSLLYDCRLPLEHKLREKLMDKIRSRLGIDPKVFKNLCAIYLAQRNIKILGNFTGLYQNDGKTGYLKYLPEVWEFIAEALENPLLEEVKGWFLTNNVKRINSS